MGIKIRATGSMWQFGIVRETLKGPGTGLVEEIHPLPKRPEGCPPWKYALTLPARSDKDNAVIFLNGRFRWVWLTDARTQIPWKTSGQPTFPEMIKASIATNRTPHRLFLEEATELMQRWAAEEKKPEREDPWPPLMRLRWLEILLATEVSEEPLPDKDGILQVRVPAERATLEKAVLSAREAAAVSLAAFTPQEIPLAHRAITNSIQKEEIKSKILEMMEKAEEWG